MSTKTIGPYTYNVLTLPASPSAPKGLEFENRVNVSQSTNPFTLTEQLFYWNVNQMHASVSYAIMKNSDAQTWVTFLEGLQTPALVSSNWLAQIFCFPTSITNTYPMELTSDGQQNSSHPLYFKLMSPNSIKWSVSPGGVYNGVIFEIKQVL